MRKEKISFKHESLQDAKAIREVLKSVSTGIANGKLTFSDEDDEISLKPEGLLHLKVSASQGTDKNKVSVSFSWYNEDIKPLKKKLLVK
jgi:amphi-Trp domain-containing protein